MMLYFKELSHAPMLFNPLILESLWQAKEIRAKVTSIKSTQNHARDANGSRSKMRRAQERMEMGRPYADSMRQVISHLVHASSDYKHPYMASRPINKVGYIVITSDRGLAGGFEYQFIQSFI